MTRLCVICEGQTELEFVNGCLWAYLSTQGVEVYPSTLKTRPGKQVEGMSRSSGSPATKVPQFVVRLFASLWYQFQIAHPVKDNDSKV